MEHPDLSHALTLARTGPRADRWRDILLCARDLLPPELARLDEALAAWPDAARAADASLLDPQTAALSVVRRLEIRANAGDALRALLASEHTSRLASIALFCEEIDLGALQQLASAPRLGALIELQLACGLWLDDAAEILASSPLPIRILTFEGTGATDRSARVLAGGQGLAALRHLQYHDVDVGDDGIATIARSERFAPLTFLRVSYARVGPDGARALGRSRTLRSLDHLGLGLNHVGAAGAEAIFSSSALASLTSLFLFENALGAAGCRAIARVGSLPQLTELSLGFNSDRSVHTPDRRFGPDGARALAALPWLSGLTKLDIAGNAIGDEGALAIATSPHLRSLTELDLTMSDLTDASVATLLSSGLLDRLRLLQIEHNALGDAVWALVDACEDRGIALVV